MASSKSNAASSANNSSQQQKTQLPNPFELADYQILHKVYLTHVNDDKPCNKDTLFKLVSNTLSSPAQISPTAPLNVQSLGSAAFQPEFPELKRIACQMISTRGSPECAHQTTILILQQLRSFSWDAKALVTLAAFSLEYGEFWRLHRIPTSDQFGTSLKVLNQVPSRKVPNDITDLVEFLVQVFRDIMEWGTWAAIGYETEEVHSLSDAMQEIPLVVYWTVASIVASIGNLVGTSEHKLSDFKKRLSEIGEKLKIHLVKCRVQIEKIDDYRRRIKASKNIKDVVDLLKILIHGNGAEIPQLYEGSVLNKTGVEVFKQKHVMLFISGLDSIGDEILLLNSIYNRLEKNATEDIKGFKKGDFKMLWIPVVDNWNPLQKERFKTLKKDIKWHVLEYFSTLPGIGILKEKFNYYDSKPIVPVINPQGEIINEDAMEVLFQWGIDAFPFRKSDGDDLSRKWKWFWSLMEKTDFNIEDTRKDRYVFIYGGNDSKWIRDFTVAIGKIKKHERIRNVDVMIEHYQLGKENPDKVPYFWIGIDGKKQHKCKDKVDCEIQEVVKSLLCLKQDPQGWVLLSKGKNIKLLGHGEPMYQAVADFDIWKEKVLEKEGFDVALKEYYDAKLMEISARNPCAIFTDNYASNILATITCPNPTCGRVMEVTSVNYKCCHRDDPNSCTF
ncbi:hypothetical protein RJT34_23494 [Clitoria ternatea]|uniref:Uncharacterized protein n=1 Tax=Clitoria ternatea TaxID=43366 RepID=A0AAN9FLR4_CLITE